jgi:hypothetical protein
MWRRLLAGAVLTALASAACWGDDRKPPPPEDPDPGFLEFLGSVDRLAEVNPDYLSQPNRPLAPAPKPVSTPSPPPPPPPQSVPRVTNND